VRAAVKSFINIRHDGNLVGVPCVEQEFEIGGLKLGDEKYFAFADIECLVETALNNPIPNGEQLPSGEVAALLLSWQESYYWNDTQTAPLPLGEATPRALIHHAAEAVFSDQTLKRLFEDSGHAVSEDILTNEGGYVHDRGYWWNNDLTAYYGKASVFFQLISARDQFGGLTAQQFDPYALFPVRVIDAEDYSVLIVNDYRTAAPTKIIDANGNVTEVLFDPLGRVFVFSMHGHIGDEPEGDLPLSEYVVRFPPSREALLCDPHDYLQGATAYYYEDTLAWNQPHPEPIYSITVTREIHQHDLVIGEQSPVIFDIEFDDSFGMTVQRKTGVPAEILPEPLGKLVLSHAAECGPPLWLTSGTVVYDNSGNIVQRYEPFFISDPTFTADPSITHVGVTDTTHYDPLGRIIRVDKSTTFFELRYYSSWAYQKLDVDDNVTESAFYRERICDLNPDFADERDALLKAAVFHDTPTTCHFDNLGNVCAITRIKVILKEIRERCGEIPPKPPEFDRVLAPLTTVTERDIEGNLISASDPRLGPKGLNNLRRVYDMMDRVLYNWSCDSGERWVLTNAVGNQFRVWDGRGFETATTFDTMQRPTLVEVTRSGHTFVAEVTEYGTDPELNQRGQIALVCDEAGVLQAGPYDLSGLLLSSERRFCEDYLSPPDWSSPEIRMQSEPYTVASTYDALGRLLRQENADGTAIVRSYFPPGWLSTVSLESEGTVQPLLDSVSYNSKGQRRIAVTAGGTVRNTCEYEPLTFRLSSVETIRLTDGRKLQDINYTYDPIGNVTRIEDRSAEHILHQQSSASPRFDYTYDALYRIVQATGREYPNLPEQAYREGFKQSGFVSLSESPPLSLRGYKQTFHYDYGDNLVQMEHEGDVDWSRKVVVSDTSNRAVPNQMIESGKSPDDFFDHNGNMASLEFIGEIDWSYRNLIYHSRSAREPSARVDSYSAYNAAGGRARHVVADDGREPTVEDTITIGDLEITTVSSGDTIRSRRLRLVVQADDGCVAEQITTLAADTDDDVAQVELRYQYSSELGSIVLELSENGDVLSYEEFFPFGGSSVIAGPNEETVRPKKYRYSGQGCDDATGLYNYGLRYYVSWMGRWPSPDPAGPVDGLNIYVFIRSNPSSSVDEGGLIQCSICGKTGHNKSNQAFHPKGSTAKLAKRYLSIGTFAGKAAKHGATLQGNAKKNITQVFVKKRKDGKTYTVYIGVIQKNLRKHPIDAANYMEDQMHEKTVRASALLASEAEKAIIKSPIHEKPSSQQFAKLDWKRTFGDDPMPMNPNGKTVNLRAAGERLAPSPAGLVDYKGRPLVKAVDELVGRGEGGSGSHAKSPLNPTELGQNQWWMDNTANSQMGAADVQILAAAKKDHLVFGVSRIMEYRLRILT
jgi:RHS repeat-associated protein